jgi:filamentous hemagglutinin
MNLTAHRLVFNPHRGQFMPVAEIARSHSKGRRAGRQLLSLDAANLNNLGGRISGNDVALSAAQDLNNTGGSISATNSLIASAGRDLNVVTTTRASANRAGQSSFTRTGIERVAGLYVTAPAGLLLASAGRDITLTGAQLANSGGGQTLIDAGRDLTLATVTTAQQDNIVWDANNHLNQGRTADIGSVIQTQGDLRLSAGNDLTARAAQVSSATGTITASAARDIRITSGAASQNWREARQATRSGLLSSTTTTNLDETNDTRAVAATFSGNRVNLQAGRDIGVTGSNVVSDTATQLSAGQGIAIEAATDTHSETHHADKVTHGLFTSGTGITLGMRQQTTDQQGQSTAAAASTVGSTQGSVAIQADKNYRQIGSDVLTPQGDIAIQAQTVDIVAAKAQSSSEQTTASKQGGITLAVSSPVISAIQTVQQMKAAASQTGDSRMQALAAGSAALATKNAADAIAANPGEVGGASIQLSIGGSQSQSKTTQTATTAQGSTVAAGGNVDIRASGAGEASDITVQGSTISAGNNISLSADDAINLLVAKNTADQHSKNSGFSASIGISLGSQTGITVAASGSRGKADGSDVTYTNTHVEAGNALSLASGGDTTLRGAVASGQQVIANVGGNLNIESLQDTSKYDSKQQSLGGSVTFGPAPGASISASQSKINSDYASVTEQSGIKAGDDGFQVTVKGNTDLKGAVIASTDQAVSEGRNSLTTGALTSRDIQNRGEASANSSGISLSSDMLTQGKYGAAKAVVGNALNNGEASGSSAGRTLSAVSGGAVVITDERKQTELTGKDAQVTVTSLNRDAANAHTAAQKQDVQVMERTAQAEQAIKQAVFKEAVKFTDESYRKMFLVKHPMLEHLRGEDGKLMYDEKGKPVMRELSGDETRNLKPGPDGKISIANNGIFNDRDAAAKYASQHSTTEGQQYLIYFPEAENAVSELLIAGYQKFLENDYFGLSNSTQATKDMMNQYGQGNLHLDGHSRGAMTIGNALESVQNQPNAQGTLGGTTINFYGAAYNAEKADNILSDLQNRDAVTDVSKLNGMVIQTETHQADPVGRIIGGNPATGGTIPEGSSTAKEAVTVLGGENTVHNCYGAGGEDCEKFWSGSPNNQPVLQPVKVYPVTQP